jgi:DNA polymerase I-like protein with 3'-5' exonuclease and polymerase domains/uracil-DNA glycosylase
MMQYWGDPQAPIAIICDPPTPEMEEAGSVIEGEALRLFADYAKANGFGKSDFVFVSPCHPIPLEASLTPARTSKYLKTQSEEFFTTLATMSPRLIVTLGSHAAVQTAQRAVKVTKCQGQGLTYAHLACPVVHQLSPYHVLRKPEVIDGFHANMRMIATIARHDFRADASSTREDDGRRYEWRTDIADIVAEVQAGQHRIMSVDTETTGLRWYMPSVKPITVQLGLSDGRALACVVDQVYWDRHDMAAHIASLVEQGTGQPAQPVLNRRQLHNLKGQLRTVLEDTTVQKVGHNIKFDHHILRKFDILVSGWFADTQLLAFLVDENMTEKSQDECVRRWVPEMAGYADHFNQTVNKSDMRSCPPEKLLPYACGDVDANLRLAQTLTALARQDSQRNWNCFKKIQMPAMGAFMDVVEPQGMDVNPAQLAELQASLDVWERETYAELIAEVPAAVKRKHLEEWQAKYKGKNIEKCLQFSRDAFVRDILFSKEGFGLKPRLFTPSTMKLEPHLRVPSVSAKDHLPYFDHNTWVVRFQDYQRIQKMRSTYVGRPAAEAVIGDDGKVISPANEASGFWQYIHEGKIHPSFLLHRTVTGRSASADPNAQNFPKRVKSKVMEEVVKSFRKVFVAPPGYKIISCDLSQIELRIVAWMAGERNMIALYNQGLDIHAATAAATMGISLEDFNLLDPKLKKAKRQLAKAINFGFIYGMWWRKFVTYAKTEYNVDVTDGEAEKFRNDFFAKYPDLEDWHDHYRNEVREWGFVDALHGARRHLPSIRSNDPKVQQEAERQAINSPVQRFGSDLGLMALARLARDAPPELIKPIAFIHDDLVCLCREDYIEEGMSAIRFYMESNPLQEWFGLTPPIPLLAEPAFGDDFADQEERPHQPAIPPDWYNFEADDRTEEYVLNFVTQR